jgi:glycosyltransferase involved in cell wall biosynthesis
LSLIEVGVSKKIVFVIDSFAGGGAERVLSRLLASLDRNRFQPSLYLLLRPEQAYVLPDDVPVSFIGQAPLPWGLSWCINVAALLVALPYLLRPTRFLDARTHLTNVMREIAAVSISLRDRLRHSPPDAVVVFLQSSIFITLLTLWLFKMPVPACCSDRIFLSREIGFLRYPGIVTSLISILYSRVERYVAVTDEIRWDMVHSFGLPENRIVTIPNGVDLELLRRLAAEPAEADWDDAATHGEVTIITSGRLMKQKGHKLLLQAFSRVCQTVPCRLVILGEGELYGDLKQLAYTLGIAENVIFAGWQRNPFRLLAKADVFVLSSHYEGFPNALLEAMALGLPVISTDCPTGPAELLDRGRYGVLVPPDDPVSLADAMLSLVRDGAQRLRFSKLSVERASQFSLAGMVTSYESLLEGLTEFNKT